MISYLISGKVEHFFLENLRKTSENKAPRCSDRVLDIEKRVKSGCEGRRVEDRGLIEVPVPPGLPIQVSGMRKSKTSRWRAAALLGLNLLMVAHIIQWRITGRTISPIEPSETMHTLQRGAVNAGFIFFSLAILATLIFGRFVCGWGCHILALQDFCGWLLKKMRINPKPFRSRLLVYVPLLAALYMFVWPTAYRYFFSTEPGPLIPKFTNHLVTNDFWGTFLRSRSPSRSSPFADS